jgi:hypothetical protein
MATQMYVVVTTIDDTGISGVSRSEPMTLATAEAKVARKKAANPDAECQIEEAPSDDEAAVRRRENVQRALERSRRGGC